MVDKYTARQAFDRQVATLESIAASCRPLSTAGLGQMEAWIDPAVRTLRELGRDEDAAQLSALHYRLSRTITVSYVDQAHALLQMAKEVQAQIADGDGPILPAASESGLARFPISDAARQVAWICERFHAFATQLAQRQRRRKTLVVRDEYDVQDALQALLKMHFRDVRREEWTPSYAGGSARVDFLLKEERIVLEAKHTGSGLTDKTVGEQLLLDLPRYRKHRHCEHLICFVYDPAHRLKNARGLEHDLARSEPGLLVWTLVMPRP